MNIEKQKNFAEKKSIGLFLTRTPQQGGAFQYSLSIIKGLASFNSEKYKIKAFYQCEEWGKYIPDSFERIYYKRPLVNQAFSWIYKRLDTSRNGYKRFPILCNPIIKKMNKSDCDIIVFADQDPESYQTKKKSLVPIHDLMHRYESHYDEYKGKVFNQRENHYFNICKYATGILVDSEVGKKQVVKSYNRNEDSIYVLKFVPPFYLLEYELTDVIEKYKLPENYLFYPAQFWQHKNHENLLKAVSILKNRGENVFLVLSGSKKNYYDNIVQLINSLDLNDNVKILGYVPNEDMCSLYRNAFALVFVSLIGPTNIPPLEAMLLGCPVICSNKYAMPEQIGDAGLLIDPNDPEDIAKKIQRLLKDPRQCETFVRKGFEKVKEWNQEKFNERLQEIILKVMSK